MGQLPEVLTCMYIGDMHFYHGCFNGCYGIADGDRGVRISAGVNDNAIVLEAYPLQFIDQLTFYIALIIIKAYLGVFLLQLLTRYCSKDWSAVNIGFPFAQQVEIRAVDDGYFHNISSFRETPFIKRSFPLCITSCALYQNKLIEQIPAVMRTRRGFRMVLHGKCRFVFQPDAFDRIDRSGSRG